MPNWEDMARQMTVPFGGIQPQPQQPRPDMNALATGMANPFGVQSSVGPSTASFGPNQMYEAWPMSLAKIMVGMLTNKINPAEVWQGFKQSAVNPPQGGIDMRKAADSAFESALNFGTGNLPMMGGLMAGTKALKAPLGKVGGKLHPDMPLTPKQLDEIVSDVQKLYPEAEGVSIAGTYSRLGEKPDKTRSHDVDILIRFPEGTKELDIAMRNDEALWNKWRKDRTGVTIDFLRRFGEKEPSYGEHQWRLEQGLPTPEVPIWKKNKSGLSLAEDLFKKGADEDAIWNQTGWRRDPKGNWAFEIDDSKAFYMEPFHSLSVDQVTAYKKGAEIGTTLPKIIDHKELFDQYPYLKEMKVYIDPNIDTPRYVPSSGLIPKYAGSIILKSLHEKKSSVIHEIQHAIQDIEGWTPGTNTQAAGYKGYWNQFGEFQARDSASRADWNAEARKTVRPYSSEMEPKEGWIFRGGEGKAESSITGRDITYKDAIKLKSGDKISVVGKDYEVIYKPKQVGGRPLMIAARPIDGGNARLFQVGAHKIKIFD